MPSFKDIKGERFGFLTVVDVIKLGNVFHCICDCECGNRKKIIKGNITRKENPTRSCGCVRKWNDTRTKCESLSGKNNPNYRHGHGARFNGNFGSKAHRTWRHMKDRCQNPRNAAYARYGGRGIRVCERWMVFENFFDDMGEPTEGQSIDRTDNDGDYEPSNCRWADSKTQTRNARSNVMNFYFGELLCASEAAEKFGIDDKTLRSRLDSGENPEDAVTRPVYVRRKRWNEIKQKAFAR